MEYDNKQTIPPHTLMVGDYVCYDGDYDFDMPERINGVYDNDISITGEGFIGGDDCFIGIPLTAEILDNNFEERDGDWYTIDGKIVYDLEHKCVSMVVNDLAFPICDVAYVHELQKALRMFGMVYKAENFILRKDIN